MADGTAHYAEKVGDTQQYMTHIYGDDWKKKLIFNSSYIITYDHGWKNQVILSYHV